MKPSPNRAPAAARDNSHWQLADPEAIPLLLALLACVPLFLAVMGLLAFAAPIADDYCRGLIGVHSAIAYANNAYMHWVGRWASMVLESTLLSAFDLYHTVPVILACLFALRLYAVAYLFRHTIGLPVTSCALWALLFTAAWLSLSPGTNEAVFWATGAMEYGLSLTLALFALAMMAQSRWFAAALLIVVASLMHELIALLLTGACVSMLWMRRRDPASLRPLLILTLVAVMVTAAALLAPGNFERALTDYQSHDTRSLSSRIIKYLHVVHVTVFNWSIAPATLGLMLFAAGRRPAGNRPAFLDVIGWPCVIAGLLVTILFTLGGGPGRVQDLLCFVYLMFLLYTAFWCASFVKIGQRVRIFGLLLFVLGIVTSVNVKSVIVSAIHAPAWKHAIAERARTHHFNRIEWPVSYFPADITSDPAYWNNRCVAGYLGMSHAALCPSCNPPP